MLRNVLCPVLTLGLLVGCDRTPANQPAATSRPAAHSHEDDHAGHSHEHTHAHHAPHGGALVVLGEEVAHVEFLLDSGTGLLTCYILDEEAQGALRIKDEVIRLRVTTSPGGPEIALELTAVENRLTGETRGNTSEFRVTDERLRGLSAFDAEIARLTIRGREFSAIRFAYPKGSD